MGVAQASQAAQTNTLQAPATGLDISIRTGSGEGSTLLSAFDHALQRAGVADLNLVTLSSVIPTGSRLRHIDAPLPAGHGDLLFCVRAEAFAERPGDTAWAGLGWCVDETGGGLFVEHHGQTEESVIEQIELSLADMNRNRGGGYGPVQYTLASAQCADKPVCALVLAAYRVSSWHEPASQPKPGSPADLAVQPVHPELHAEQRAAANGVIDPRRSHGHVVTGSPSSEPPLYDDSVVDREPEPAPVPVAKAGGGVARVSIEKEVDYSTAKLYYKLYRASFSILETQAVGRHLLHETEFLEEMLDPRVMKYVAWDEDDQAIGMTTLTCDLETVPWISPGWFAHHYPEHHERGAIYYFGLALVHPAHQGVHVLRALIEPMADEVISHLGVFAFDLCEANDNRGFAKTYMKMLESLAEVSFDIPDRQIYYTGVFHGPLQEAREG